jgi:outer membrane receptor for ferrienterochelin and colicins
MEDGGWNSIFHPLPSILYPLPLPPLTIRPHLQDNRRVCPGGIPRHPFHTHRGIRMFPRNVRHPALLSLLALAAVGVGILPAQSTGTIRGTVTRSGSTEAIAGVQITVQGTGLATATSPQGRYTLQRIPAGSHVVVFRWLGYQPVERTVNIQGETTLDVQLEPVPVSLADVTVSAASREPERIVEAPAAVTMIEPQVLQNTAPTGQAPLALAQAPGVDLVQSGVNDFNINARGFNSSLNRRVLTLLDGRDLAIAFLGSQEWNTLPVTMDELRGMELVRGPGSALYGANAFAGVINMTTQSPREAPGGKFSLSGGEMESMKADGRWAGVFGEGRFGIRLNGGYATNDTWSRSRTLADRTSLQQEYAEAIEGSDEITVPLVIEVRALNGQTCGGDTEICAGATRTPEGDREPVTAMYGSGRFDYYLDNGGAITFEGGASQVENEVLVTGIGRVQVIKGFKPYGRVAYSSDRLNVFGYWNRRESKEPQYSMASGAVLLEKSDIMHVEAQGNADFMDGDGRLIGGASFRQYNVNTEGTLMRPEDDDRSDKVYSGYAQLEYRITDRIRLVGAARYDEGDLFEGQFSPKGAIVFSPNDNHSFRFTVNRAFQTPNYSEFFLRAAAGAPVNFSALEAGMRAHPQLGPALAGVPEGTLFTNSAAVPIFARGNANLDVEKTIGYEVGWKGSLSSKVYVTVDAYMNNIKDFVTDLLPGINPAFGAWTAPEAVPQQARAALEGAIRQTLAGNPATALAAAGLSRTEDGNTAIVVSYGNAGEVDQTGVDVGVGFQLNDEFRLDGTFSYFDFEVVSQQAGDQLVPNTPEKKGTLSLGYIGLSNGFDATVTMRIVEEYDWAAGVFVGKVPASNTINASAGYQLTPNFRIFAVGTNLLDEQRYHLFGGSVIGRRVLGGITAGF